MTTAIIKSPMEAYLYAYDNGLKFPSNWNITKNFSWNEMFLNEPILNVPCIFIFENIFDLMQYVQMAREKLGLPFIVTRVYSSIEHNKNAKSKAKLSCHLLGMAIDFYIKGVSSDTIRKLLLDCGLPIRIENKTQGWNHIDRGTKYIKNGFRWGLYDA